MAQGDSNHHYEAVPQGAFLSHDIPMTAYPRGRQPEGGDDHNDSQVPVGGSGSAPTDDGHGKDATPTAASVHDPNVPPLDRWPPSRLRNRWPWLSKVTKSRVTKYLRYLPILHKPSRDPTKVWLAEHDRASMWLGLLYDLVVVAALGVFGKTHELADPIAIPNFLSYFIILVTVWTTQVHYDERYEAEDVVHRFLKAAQLLVFAFIGASSSGWNPILMQPAFKIPTTDSQAADQVTNFLAVRSFKAVVLAYAASRSLLFLQFAFVIGWGWWHGRTTGNPWVSACTCLVSAGWSFGAAFYPVNLDGHNFRDTKMAFLYLGICIDLIGVGVQQWFTKKYTKTPAPVVEITERYGAFTLSILGEGFMGLCYSFSTIITTPSSTPRTVYLQAALVILVYILLWHFLFFNFSHKDRISGTRNTLWELVHLPLHFAMLLLLSGLVNAVKADAFTGGLFVMLGKIYELYGMAVSGDEVTDEEREALIRFFFKLDQSFLSSLEGIRQQPTKFESRKSFYIYCGSLIAKLCEISGVIISGPHLDVTYTPLKNLSLTTATDQTIPDQAENLLYQLVTEVASDAFSGVRWLFPVAGAVLMFCAIRSSIRYDFGAPGRFMHGVQFFLGLLLGLGGGLANIGDDSVMIYQGKGGWFVPNPKMNGMFWIVKRHAAVGVVFAFYAAAALFTWLGIRFWRWRRPQAFRCL